MESKTNGTDELVTCQAETDTDVENKHMDTKGGKPGVDGSGCGMNWETGIDIYTLICIK